MSNPPSTPGSRRDRRLHPYGDGAGIGPDNLPRGSYEVGIILVCRKHPKQEMGSAFRSTVPGDEDTPYSVRPIPGTNLLPQQNPHDVDDGFTPKFLGVCTECGAERIVSTDKIEAALAAIYRPWRRRVATVQV